MPQGNVDREEEQCTLITCLDFTFSTKLRPPRFFVVVGFKTFADAGTRTSPTVNLSEMKFAGQNFGE